MAVISYTVKNPDLLETKSAADGLTFHQRPVEEQRLWLRKCSFISGSGVSEKKPRALQDLIDMRRLLRGPHSTVMYIHQRRGYLKIDFTITELKEKQYDCGPQGT